MNDNARLMGLRFREKASNAELIFEGRDRPSEGVIVFSFYINSNGDMLTVSDPLKLAKLILIGHEFEPSIGCGDHVILLNSYANVREISSPTSYGDGYPRYVSWDYEHVAKRPNIKLQDWLVKELYSRPLSFEEKKIRHEFMTFLAELEQKPMSWVEQWLWWL